MHSLYTVGIHLQMLPNCFVRQTLTVHSTDQVGSSSNASDLCSEEAGFESRLEHQLY
jgi:hypothetical protein